MAGSGKRNELIPVGNTLHGLADGRLEAEDGGFQLENVWKKRLRAAKEECY